MSSARRQHRRFARTRIDLGPVRTSPRFRRLLFSQAICLFAWRLVFVLGPLQVYELTRSTTIVGLLALTQFMPIIAVGIVGGAAADATDRRLALLASSSVLVAAMIAFTINAHLSRPSVAAIFAASLAAACANAFGPGTMMASLAGLVSPDKFSAVASLTGFCQSLAAIGGPAVAGIVLQQAGVASAYTVALATAALGTCGVITLPRLASSRPQQRVTRGLVQAGLRYVAGNTLLSTLFIIDTVAVVVGMPTTLFPAVAVKTFGAPHAVGWLYAAPAAGALIAATTAGWTELVPAPGQAVVVSIVAWGLAIAGFGLAPTLAVAIALLVLAGAADGFNLILRNTIVLSVTPDHLRGRVGALGYAQIAGAGSLGNIEAALVASATSVRFAIVAGGLAGVFAAAIAGVTVVSLRRYRSPAGAGPADPPHAGTQTAANTLNAD